MALSPMMQQYLDIKQENEDNILFFRVGDFYEMFFEDAKLVSKELDLVLTGKSCGLPERAPMCGVPFHSVDTYVAKLVEKGYKVAICEQTTDPETSKGLVEREVIQVITPGTITSSTMLEEQENNYLAALFADGQGFGFSYGDVSTGELYVTLFSGVGATDDLLNELTRIGPRELLVNDEVGQYLDDALLENLPDCFLTRQDSQGYQLAAMKQEIQRQFPDLDEFAFSLKDNRQQIMALGSLLKYLRDTQKHDMDQLIALTPYLLDAHMALDRATITNLELTETLFERERKGSLLDILDRTHTAMGARKLKKWLKEPLNRRESIQERLDGVEALYEDTLLRNNLAESLKAIYDFERLATKIATGSANGKDLIALGQSLAALPEIKYDLTDQQTPLLRELGERMDLCEDIRQLIDEAIVEEPPFSLREGGIIRLGYSAELDDMIAGIADAKEWIKNLEQTERERTGIPNLKVGYNKVFGYYIEVTSSKYDLIPEDYIRKQTLVNAERFIIPELKEKEELVANAQSRINKLEYDLFTEVRLAIKERLATLQETGQCISTLDVLCSFAKVSEENGYVKPVVTDGDELIIKGGRHPVIEQTMGRGAFVSNDVYLNRDNQSLLLITGPNMSGKSTYMRQTALIVLLAQVGCFVPAQEATIGIVDRIFTRIGASDNLAQGQSTFFVEMHELAYILKTATEKSLILLDEIGRGTSTYDGLSIAWAVCQYLCQEDRQIRTMFASHYHELTDLEKDLKGLKNYNVDVREEGGEIVFLHKIVEGSASKSYGIQVAKLAGVPKELLESAQDKLQEMELRQEEMYGDQGQQLRLL